MSSLLQKGESHFCPGFLKRRQVWVGDSAGACCLMRHLCGFINAGRMSRVGLLRWAQWSAEWGRRQLRLLIDEVAGIVAGHNHNHKRRSRNE